MGKTVWPPKSKRNEPFWEIAEMFPYQGDWTEQEYQSFISSGKLGKCRFAPLKLKVSAQISKPDLLFALTKNHHFVGSKFWTGADLVMEIVREDRDSHERDYKNKRADYAKAGVSEYWIVDPHEVLITVLILEGKRYKVAGKCTPKQVAKSVLLDGFSLSVSDVFAAANS